MEIKDRLKESECGICADALFEIIRLEADLISMNKRYDRMLNWEHKNSDMMRAKVTPKSRAGAALNKAIRP